MYVRRNIRWSIIWQFAGRSIFFFIFYSAAVVALYNVAITYGIDISIPFAPLGTLGVAVAFYIGFKNNQAYDRFWEARKIWGGIVNDSRSWANQVLSLVTPSPEQPDEDMEPVHRRLILRQLAWINTVRAQLRKTTIHDRKVHTSYTPNLRIDLVRGSKDNICKFISEEERAQISPLENVASQLLRVQGAEIKELRLGNHIDGFQERMLHEIVRELYALQGKCERIRTHPYPVSFRTFRRYSCGYSCCYCRSVC